MAADLYATNPRTGRVVLDLAGRIAGGGLILSIDGEAGRQVNVENATRIRKRRLSARPRKRTLTQTIW